ncbi:MAG TPA: potassium-transporting ATPase subunit C [Streptosporangiaceae bacterium]
MRLPTWIRQHLAAVRALLVLTLVTGIVYPLAVWAVAEIPGLHDKAQGSTVKAAAGGGRTAGSKIIGQSFTDAKGNPLVQYFQSRPSAAGDGYDPTSTSASNLGPEDIVDTLPDPAIIKTGKEDENARQSLLTQVCSRSKAVGRLDGVSGARPFCTPGGVGAVLSVFGPRDSAGDVPRPTRVVSVNEECPSTPFVRTYHGVTVRCATYGADYAAGKIVPIRGTAPAPPPVPPDAVTASASGLDPQISPAYARSQAPRVARVRGITVGQVLAAIKRNETGRALGFMGQPAVNVVRLNLELDAKYPYHG